jgi:hypothetical protein
VDTLKVHLYIYHLDSLIKTEETDARGNFDFELPDKGPYKVRFSLIGKIYRDTLLNTQQDVKNMKVCLADSGFHNYYLRQIPFDSLKAKRDILNDTIRIVSLISKQYSGCRLSYLQYLSAENITLIEKQFGFTYNYFELDFNQGYLDQRQNEYNRVVYNYLDKQLNGDSFKLIRDKIIELAKLQRAERN